MDLNPPVLVSDSSNHSSLEELFETIEDMSGLEVSIYPPPSQNPSLMVHDLPVNYRRHMSDFCRCVKMNRKGTGCWGHDAKYSNERASEIGKAFIQVCYAGIAEVIVPVVSKGEHLATVFLGQVKTETVVEGGYAKIEDNLKTYGVEHAKLKPAFEKIPHMSAARLMKIGRLLESALKSHVEAWGHAHFAQEVSLRKHPAVWQVIDTCENHGRLDISAAKMAKLVHLSLAHFSRLFRSVMGKTYSEYVETLKIRQAQRLLHHTNAPIGEIAQRCGFSRQSYFSRRFLDVTGMTPRAFRKAKLNPENR